MTMMIKILDNHNDYDVEEEEEGDQDQHNMMQQHNTML